MKTKTADALGRLQTTVWFRAVGEPITDDRVRVVANWSEAAECCDRVNWEDITLEAANELTASIRAEGAESIRNMAADEIDVLLGPVITDKAVDSEGVPLPRAVASTIEWDLVHYLLQVELLSSRGPAFFIEQAQHYLAGRFPCGWEGPFPEGTRLVY